MESQYGDLSDVTGGPPRYEMRRVEGGWAMVSTWTPAVPASQPPPPDMPPLDLVVLDSLADGDETLYTLRDCGETAPNGLALVGEEYILVALRELLGRGLIAVTGELREQPSGDLKEEQVLEPATDDGSLRRYWFGLTADGDAVRQAAVEVLDAYYDRPAD